MGVSDRGNVWGRLRGRQRRWRVGQGVSSNARNAGPYPRSAGRSRAAPRERARRRRDRHSRHWYPVPRPADRVPFGSVGSGHCLVGYRGRRVAAESQACAPKLVPTPAAPGPRRLARSHRLRGDHRRPARTPHCDPIDAGRVARTPGRRTRFPYFDRVVPRFARLHASTWCTRPGTIRVGAIACDSVHCLARERASATRIHRRATRYPRAEREVRRGEAESKRSASPTSNFSTANSGTLDAFTILRPVRGLLRVPVLRVSQ